MSLRHDERCSSTARQVLSPKTAQVTCVCLSLNTHTHYIPENDPADRNSDMYVHTYGKRDGRAETYVVVGSDGTNTCNFVGFNTGDVASGRRKKKKKLMGRNPKYVIPLSHSLSLHPSSSSCALAQTHTYYTSRK